MGSWTLEGSSFPSAPCTDLGQCSQPKASWAGVCVVVVVCRRECPGCLGSSALWMSLDQGLRQLCPGLAGPLAAGSWVHVQRRELVRAGLTHGALLLQNLWAPLAKGMAGEGAGKLPLPAQVVVT